MLIYGLQKHLYYLYLLGKKSRLKINRKQVKSKKSVFAGVELR